jgi:hypothetical protein
VTTTADPLDRRHLYCFSPASSQKLLKILGWLDLFCGALVLLAGLGLTIAAINPGSSSGPPLYAGLICLVGALLALWAGLVMAFGRVVVTPDRLRAMNLWWRSANRDQIDRIDLVRSDFGALKRVLPIVVLKDGRSFRLLRLAWPFRGRGGDKSGLTPEHQQELVAEIRTILGVGGSNFPNP